MLLEVGEGIEDKIGAVGLCDHAGVQGYTDINQSGFKPAFYGNLFIILE